MQHFRLKNLFYSARLLQILWIFFLFDIFYRLKDIRETI